MVPSSYLLEIFGRTDFSMYQKPGNGIQWKGQHFFVIISYALNLSSGTSEHDRFSDQLRHLEYLARECFYSHPHIIYYTRFLQLVDSLMAELWELLFAVPKAMHDLYSGNEIIASFVHCLVEALDQLLVGRRDPNIIVPSEINALWEKLNFLLAILGDKPFQCSQLEETKNVLGEIESTANEAGIFLLSFFFTMDRVTCAEVDRGLSVLLPMFERVEAKIIEYCVTISGQPTQTTTSTPSFSIFIIDSVLDDLNHLINQRKADFIVDVNDQIRALYEELNYSRSFLMWDTIDQEMRQTKQLSALVKQLIELAYEVEYLVSWFVDGTLPVWYFALRISTFIQKNKLITKALQEIKKLLKFDLGNDSAEVSETPGQISLTQVAKTDPVVDEIIVGFEEKTIEIVNQLVRGPYQLQIVSILGMGGIGKTTLAKKLYNHSFVVDHFDRRSWCVVSQIYQKKKLLIDILRCITKINEVDALRIEEDALAELIYKNFKGNRYLLVIDDIWDKKTWEDMKRYFPNDANGSRILFTTRNKDAAHGIINELPLLLDDECWELLKRKLFREGLCPPKLVESGKKIAVSCKGLPLAVIGIAGVLANMANNESSWQEVARGLSSFISKNQDILELSYRHLPVRLKPCFLYLGIFEEDAEINVRELLQQWISHGFIPKKEGKSTKDFAEDFLMELINRSMVEVVKKRWDNGVKTCKLHDVVRDMCLRIAKEETFLKVIEDEFSIYEQHHHLYRSSSRQEFKSIPFGLHVRSLYGTFSKFFINNSGYKLLRDLHTREIDDTALEILVHLRYLEVQRLISSKLSHGNLEYLLVKDEILQPDHDVDFLIRPNRVLLNMPKLRHVEFPDHVRFMSSFWGGGLETLFGILICVFEDEKLLKKFSSLRHLKCTYDDDEDDKLLDKIDLSSLTLLESLSISTSFCSYIFEITFPNNIKKVTLTSFSYLDSEILSSLGKLLKLESLKLAFCSIVPGGIWITKDDGFQALKYLKLVEMFDFQEWNISRDHFPKLERLVLKFTEHPKSLPSELGYIPTLQFIELYGCVKDVQESALKIRDEQIEEGNEDLKVVIQGRKHLFGF